jgi:hypothetical protein
MRDFGTAHVRIVSVDIIHHLANISLTPQADNSRRFDMPLVPTTERIAASRLFDHPFPV